MATTSRLPELLQSFQTELKRIDELERRIDETSARRRRRFALDRPLRPSHIRLFASHTYEEGAFKFQLEGKLLVGHLDAKSAEEFDRNIQYEPLKPEDLGRNDGPVAEEETVAPILFTHMWDRIRVRLQTHYTTPEQKSPTKKSSRRGSTAKKMASPPSETPAIPPSVPLVLDWHKSLTPDAHALVVPYTPPASSKGPVEAVVVHAELYPLSIATPVYQIQSPELAKLFPMHTVSTFEPGTETDYRLPHALTMSELVHGIFVYAQDRGLTQGDADQSVIHCNPRLQSIFGSPTLPFSQLQMALLPLLKDASHEPVRITYRMTETDAEGTEQPLVLQFDWMATIPRHPRTNDLLRRVKRREWEYTSSRTKARYILQARKLSEDEIRVKMEQAIKAQCVGPELVETHLALSKSSTGEAKTASLLDARMCYLVGRLEEERKSAIAARRRYDEVVHSV